LERGLADGQVTHFPVLLAFGILELFNYHTIFGEGGASMTPDSYIINLDTWNSLPPDIQKMMKEILEQAAKDIIDLDKGEVERGIKTAEEEMGHTLTRLTPGELQVWADAFETVYEQWIADNAAKGPSRAILEEARRLIKEYSK
jgi:TRAP-type C4-dicarboxylate transport system substrate-binding protein